MAFNWSEHGIPTIMRASISGVLWVIKAEVGRGFGVVALVDIFFLIKFSL